MPRRSRSRVSEFCSSPASGAAGRSSTSRSRSLRSFRRRGQRHRPVFSSGGLADVSALCHADQHGPRRACAEISEPSSFVQDVSKRLGPFYTTGFQEDHKARSNGIFSDDDLPTGGNGPGRAAPLFDYAMDNYDDGLLFFYFSSSDLQSHIFWWDSDEKHPIRSEPEAKAQFGHVRRLYQKLDAVIGDLMDRYGSRATIIVMSDHGFANFGTQFNLNSWLRDARLPGPARVLLDHARRRLVEHRPLTDWESTDFT